MTEDPLSNSDFVVTSAIIDPLVPSPQQGDTEKMLSAKIANILIGGVGSAVVNSTATQTYSTIGFVCITDTIFATAVADTGYSVTNITGITFTAGMTLPFRLSSFSLTSGSVLVIKT